MSFFNGLFRLRIPSTTVDLPSAGKSHFDIKEEYKPLEAYQPFAVLQQQHEESHTCSIPTHSSKTYVTEPTKFQLTLQYNEYTQKVSNKLKNLLQRIVMLNS